MAGPKDGGTPRPRLETDSKVLFDIRDLLREILDLMRANARFTTGPLISDEGNAH